MTASNTIDLQDYQVLNHTTNAAQTLLTSGTHIDSTGVSHCVYPQGHTWWPERHYHYYPWPAPQPQGLIAGTTTSPEKPHETVQRAMQEIAAATRELARSAKEIGVPVDQRALEEALIEKLRAAL